MSHQGHSSKNKRKPAPKAFPAGDGFRLYNNTPVRRSVIWAMQPDDLHHMSCTRGIRFVDSLHHPDVTAYWPLELRLSWRPQPNVELSVVGLNLLDSQHLEFYPTQVVTPPREVQRSVYGKIS